MVLVWHLPDREHMMLEPREQHFKMTFLIGPSNHLLVPFIGINDSYQRRLQSAMSLSTSRSSGCSVTSMLYSEEISPQLVYQEYHFLYCP